MNQMLTVSQTHPAPPCTIVIFGASGDLARRKLIPALYNLRACGQGLIAPETIVLGVARRPMSTEEFRSAAREGVTRYSRLEIEEGGWSAFAARLEYMGGSDEPTGFVELRQRLEQIEQARGLPPNRIFYLAVPPQAMRVTVERLSAAGLISRPGADNFTRVVVEKPIGHDLASAVEINRTLHQYLEETQIFRIDHYLGKETVQNLMVLRFANSIFERVWGTRNVDHVQITVSESEGLGTRAAYYDQAGALRDMVQNHMLQLLTLIGMEPPVSLESSAVRNAKLDVLKSLRPITREQVRTLAVRARYAGGVIEERAVRGYLEEPGVPPASRTETFVALKLFIDNWRWSGVPFYLRTGKRLPHRASAIFVQFKDVPAILFNRQGGLTPDVLELRIQPDEGFSFNVLAKQPGLDVTIRPVSMNLSYENEFSGPSPDAYERLLLDVMIGDHTLFISGEFVRLSWQLLQPILDEWRDDSAIPMEVYPAGGWGPDGAEALIRADGRSWKNV
jgi:glucose-6-phosphate 1-dehydrogenase